MEVIIADLKERANNLTDNGTTPPDPIQYMDLFLKHESLPHVPWYLAAALVKWESGFDRLALSHAGAWGLGQAMIKTWDAFGHGSPTDPDGMIEFVVTYLLHVRTVLGAPRDVNWHWVPSGYSAGPYAATDAVE